MRPGEAAGSFSCVSYPKCRGVAPLTGAVLTALLLLGGKSSSTPPAGKVRSGALCDRPHPQRAESGGSVGGETREIIKRCSALESTPTPPE